MAPCPSSDGTGFFICPYSMSTHAALRDRLLALAQEATRGSDVFVLDVQVRGGAERLRVDVVADTDAGIIIDELARLSRELGFVYETHEVISGAYDLNVLSPGAKEPLLPRQYARNVGRALEVSPSVPEGEPRPEPVTGVLKSASPDGFVIELPDGTERSFAFTDIERARVKLPW